MDVKMILLFSLSLLVTLSFCEEDGKGIVEEICGKGQGLLFLSCITIMAKAKCYIS